MKASAVISHAAGSVGITLFALHRKHPFLDFGALLGFRTTASCVFLLILKSLQTRPYAQEWGVCKSASRQTIGAYEVEILMNLAYEYEILLFNRLREAYKTILSAYVFMKFNQS
jgi:hypothetical protein